MEQTLEDGKYVWVVPSEEHSAVALFYCNNDSVLTKEEAVANAKLFCAANALLEACQEFVRKVECGEANSKRSYAQMQEAIKLATE